MRLMDGRIDDLMHGQKGGMDGRIENENKTKHGRMDGIRRC